MKRFFALTLALALTFSLTACGSKDKELEAIASAPTASSAVGPEEVAWPTGNITLVVSAAAGGGTDLTARALASVMNTYGEANFGVENKTEGGGVPGWEEVRTSDPEVCDELVFWLTGMYMNYLSGMVDIHPVDDFVTVWSAATGSDYFLVANKNAPYDTLEELIAYTHEHPGEITIGSPPNSMTTLWISHMEEQTGIEWSVVAAETDAIAIGNVMGGTMDLYLTNQGTTDNYYAADEVKVLCNIHGDSTTASEKLLNVPTLEELGYENTSIKNNFIVLAPKGADQAVYEKMNRYFQDAFHSEEYQADCKKRGVQDIEVGDFATTQKTIASIWEDFSNLWDAYMAKQGS